MTTYQLYRGVWPQNVSKLAKYNVRFVDREWKVTVWCDMGEGMRYFAVDGGGHAVAEQVNAVKQEIQNKPGGIFYVNEYRHVVVPVTSGSTSVYYYGGKLKSDLTFDFEGRKLTSEARDRDGVPLKVGDAWVGPRPGIPYVLSAGAGDIYFETPALTDGNPPELRANMIRKVQLSKVLKDPARVDRAVHAIAAVRGHSGGRFYVNEHGAMFSPVDKGDGNGINYIYCGEIDREAWFPEPAVP